MAGSWEKGTKLLEERVGLLIKRYRHVREKQNDLKVRVEELEAKLARQTDELERLRRKASTSGRDLDDVYLKSRERVYNRLNSLLNRLDSL